MKALPILLLVLAGWPLTARGQDADLQDTALQETAEQDTALLDTALLDTIEQNAAERRQRLERLETLEAPIKRVVLAEQQLVAWIPERFEQRRKTAELRIYGDSEPAAAADPEDPVTSIAFFRFPAQPGLGLIHAWELVSENLRDEGFLKEVLSLRKLELAGRPALEAVAATERGGHALSSRLVLTLDPDQPYMRQVVVHCPRGEEDSADILLKGLLRDWTPLDQGTWDSSFETLRSTMIPGDDTATRPWAERNRLLDAISQPAAIARPWALRRLQSLAQGRPALLIDGLLHHHPRVRTASLEALLVAAMDPDLRRQVLILALRDTDPIVRYTGARLAAAEPELATAALPRILAVDQAIARSGTFQLLALLDQEPRRRLLAEAFADRDQYPARTQALLASLLGEWGQAAADRPLRSAWKRTTEDELRHAAFGELLRRDHPEILVHARKRLADPAREDPLSVDRAVRYLIAESEADAGTEQLEQLEELARGLAPPEEDTPEEDTPEKDAPKAAEGESSDAADDRETPREWTRAAEQLHGFAEHLRGLPDTATSEDECRIVDQLLADDPGLRWAWRRSAGLSCGDEAEEPRVARFLQVEVPRPGSLLINMRDLLDRLQLGSPEDNRVYHTLLGFIFDSIEDSFADPLSAESTGLDLTTAWRWQSWMSSGDSGDLTDPAADTSVTVRCSDPERCLHLLVRAATDEVPLEEALREGVVVSAMLPLLPAVLGLVWDDQRQISLGEDDTDYEEPAEVHMALVGGDGRWRLRRLKQFRKKTPAWSTVLTAEVDGHQVTLSPRSHQAEVEPDEPEAVPEATPSPPGSSPAGPSRPGDVLLEVDVATVLRLLQSDDDEPWVQQLIDAGLHMDATFGFDGAELATRFSVSGLPAKWLDVFRNRPAGELRAPAELLPADTLFWAGVSLDAELFSGLLRDEPESWTGALDEIDTKHLLAAAAAAGSEVGLAVIGLPEPAEDATDAWLDRLLVYLQVEPRAAQRFLDRAMTRSRRAGKATAVYRQGSLRAARAGEFLVLASNERLLAELGAGPRLATTAFYDQIAARSPAETAMVTALHVDFFAQSLIDRLPVDPEGGTTELAIEFLRAFGPIVAWWGRQGDLIEGRVSLRPDLLSEEARERVRRLVGYVGYTSGSIPVDGFATELADDSIEQLEAEVELADAAWSLSAVSAGPGSDAGGSEASERLRLVPSAVPGTFELISRAAVALPESSSLSLPIEGEQLAPYLRSERGLGLRAQEINDLARDIRAGENDPAKIIRAVIDWVGENLEYRSIDGTENTAEILASRQADCTEFTHLTIALCRSLGIPARGVTGASLGGDLAILHRWAEVYLDRWYEIDPTNGQTRVPARTVPLPGNDGQALVTTPGNRLRLQALRAGDGGLARRLVELPAGRLDDRIEIAASGDRVLIAHAVRGDDAPHPIRLLHSADRGETWSDLTAGDALGELVGLAGGHGKLLWLGRDQDGGSRLHEAGAAGLWRDLSAQVRQELGRGLGVEPSRWSLAAVAEGFLVLAAGDPSRAALLDPELSFQHPLTLPGDLGDARVLARERPLLAHATLEGGVALSEWQGQEWTILVDFSDSAGLLPQRLLTSGPRVEVICRDPERDRQTVLWWSADTGKHNRETPKNGVPVQDSVTVDGWIWKAWRDGRGLFFSRRLE